tara:strand:+ start:3568 stop:4185 length:618 start_codon:yes stop_codon:yes gene_type:complete
MIDDKRKFIFTHIHKTAGKSVKSILYFDANDKYINRHIPLSKEIDENNKDYFKFSFVRNPYDRLVSKYFYDLNLSKQKELNDGGPEGRGRAGSTKNCSNFNEWLLNHGRRVHNLLPRMKAMVCDKHGNILADYIGRFEKLEEDFDYIKEKLCLQGTLEHINKNPLERKKNYLDYYDQESIELVNLVYKDDFEIFDYEMIKIDKND